MDLDVKIKAVMIGACFLIVSGLIEAVLEENKAYSQSFVSCCVSGEGDQLWCHNYVAIK